MRLRTGVLILCLVWHIAAPIIGVATVARAATLPSISTEKDPSTSCWIPCTSDARELVLRLERHTRLWTPRRMLELRPFAAPPAEASRTRPPLQPSVTWPRRQRCALARQRHDDPS